MHHTDLKITFSHDWYVQKLRIWRNASLHHDEQRWASEGPRSAQEASEHLTQLEAYVSALEGRMAIVAT